MQRPLIVLLIGFFILFVVGYTPAAENQFKKNNPDVNKYEFARSYISALSYFREIEKRWSQTPSKKKFAGDDLKIIRGNIEYYVLDNSNLRIAKNYITKYLDSPNLMMRKVSDILIVACDRDIDLNNKAKNLWQNWLNFKTQKKPKPAEERDFVNSQRSLELQRKESDKTIIKASILLTKVVLSQNNFDEKGRMLALTQKQRDKLITELDQYGKDVTDWGIKPGQSTLDASIAVIREVLEDPIFIAHK